MTILLINANPVVSRLFDLCTRDDDMHLETISDIDDASGHRYDVLFVDEASCKGDITFLSSKFDVGKKVYLSYGEEPIAGFDENIKKPFLPSQVIDVLKRVEVRELEEDEPSNEVEKENFETHERILQDEVPTIFPLYVEEEDSEDEHQWDMSHEVLDRNEIEKIKSLLEMDEEEGEEVELSDETYESRKIEVIKEQLIADGLEILEEEEIADMLNEANEQKKEKKKKTKLKTSQKGLKLSKEEMLNIQRAIETAIADLKPKKMKKLLKGKEIELTIKLEDEKA